LHSIITRILNNFGYKIVRFYRLPVFTIDPFDLGVQLFLNNSVIKIIQVGANDGITNDPVFKYINANSKFHGVLVEPFPPIFKTLVKNYNNSSSDLKFLNAAVSDFDGKINLFISENANINSDHQKSSVMPYHIQKHCHGAGSNTLAVPCYTIKSIVNMFNIINIDILLIDAEGHDWTILNSAFSDGIHPSMIMLEVIHLSRADKLKMREHLDQLDYLYFETNKDLLALKREILRIK